MWGILLTASLVLLADSLIRYDNGEGSVWEIGLNLLGVVPGGRLLTALGKVAGLSAVGTRVVAATSRGLAAGRATVVEMSQSVRRGFASRLAFMGDETGSVRLLPARATHRFGALRGSYGLGQRRSVRDRCRRPHGQSGSGLACSATRCTGLARAEACWTSR